MLHLSSAPKLIPHLKRKGSTHKIPKPAVNHTSTVQIEEDEGCGRLQKVKRGVG